ncbi:transposase [Streptomyces monashensis]|uniref:transposase n=1 Tax=Streptomyces monashensis TaxID=1678012 RepID=UPI003F53EB86
MTGFCTSVRDAVCGSPTPTSQDAYGRHLPDAARAIHTALFARSYDWAKAVEAWQHSPETQPNVFIARLVEKAAPQLLEPFGIGVDTAAEILVVAGDNPERIKSEADLAKLAGIAPVPTGSGMTNGRHRINHGGHRQLNAAIYRTVIVRMRFHQPTIDYVARRTAEGKTKREIIRCLKRYVIREVCHLLRPAPSQPSQRVDNYRSVNALMESAIGLYKTELIKPQRPWKTLSQAELATAEWVNWCNHRRLHGEIVQFPPVEYEANYYTELTKHQVTATI